MHGRGLAAAYARLAFVAEAYVMALEE